MAKRSIIVVVPTLLYFSATRHCNENPVHVFPEKELRSLSLNFHIHVSVSDLYPKIYPHIFLQQDRQTAPGNIWIAHIWIWMWNWDWGLAIPFLGIFVTVLCLCSVKDCQVKRFPFEMENVADDLGVSSFDSLCLEPFSNTYTFYRLRLFTTLPGSRWTIPSKYRCKLTHVNILLYVTINVLT